MRADRYLVEHGHYPSRARAQAAIRAGCVRVDGRVLKKVSATIGEAAQVNAKADHPWVSRGGLKLDHALAEFEVDVTGRHCLDIGSSTGGFTQVLLARGAAHVVAVDVGTDQFHESLRGNARITLLEQTDARSLTREQVGEPSILVCDASFIPLAQVLPVPLSLARAGAVLIALVKPQFEVGRDKVGRGGIVRDRAAREQAISDASSFLAGEGWDVRGLTDSPVTGGSGSGRLGNREALLMAVKAH